ncbi:MAG TPA: hypothetical protein VLN08_13470, partial [Vicinamibacterales bacterium]|nr:hypothetical protein [Vicinamibacterales bacterium]
MAQLEARYGKRALPALLRAVFAGGSGVPRRRAGRALAVASLPALMLVLVMGLTWNTLTQPREAFDTSELVEMGMSDEPAEALGPETLA